MKKTREIQVPFVMACTLLMSSSGTRVKVTPIKIIDIENLIVDNTPKIKGKRTLSDHGAVWVRYRLS